MSTFAEILSSEMIDTIYSMASTEKEEEHPIIKDKYLHYKQILEIEPTLKEKIRDVFSIIPSVPAIHITSRAFKSDTDIVDSGFVSGIKQSEFRSKDTNIGVFMARSGKRQIADPIDFVEHPERFLREMETLIKHYYHHGTRTNKNILEDTLGAYKGIPVMLILDITDVKLISGSDYEDHYKLGAPLQGKAIIGEIDLEGIGDKIMQELPRIAHAFLDQTQSYFTKAVHTS